MSLIFYFACGKSIEGCLQNSNSAILLNVKQSLVLFTETGKNNAAFLLPGLKNIIKLQDILRKLISYIIKGKHLETLGIIILTSSAYL